MEPTRAYMSLRLLPPNLYASGHITLSALTCLSQRPLTATVLSKDLLVLVAQTAQRPSIRHPATKAAPGMNLELFISENVFGFSRTMRDSERN